MTDSMQVTSQQGNPRAGSIEDVFLNHYALVYRTAYRVTGSPTDAEDVLQTLFMRLVRNPPDRLRTGWPTYLKQAAVNVSLDLVRRRARNASLGDMEPWIESPEPDPHRRRESAELGDRLRTALSRMHRTSAQIFVLRHVEGYTNQEIAGMLGTSRGSVAVTLFRARNILRKSLSTFRGGR